MIRLSVNADLFRRAAVAQSTEQTRYYLNGVHISRNPNGGVTMVATDGHRLICIHDAAGRIDGADVHGVIVRLPKAALKACVASTKSYDPLNERWLALEAQSVNDAAARAVIARLGTDKGNNAAIAAKQLERPSAIVAHTEVGSLLVEGSFPDWQRCIPRDFIPGGPLGAFNGKYVAECASALSDGRSQCANVVSSGDLAAPFWVMPAMPELQGIAFAIVMPMRAEARAKPTFYQAEMKAAARAEAAQTTQAAA